MLNLSKKLKIKQKLMLVIKISFGAFIGLIVGILSFIVLGSILSSFSIPKPTEIYRYSSQKSLIEFFLVFYPIAFMIFGSIAGGCLTAFHNMQKSD